MNLLIYALIVLFSLSLYFSNKELIYFFLFFIMVIYSYKRKFFSIVTSNRPIYKIWMANIMWKKIRQRQHLRRLQRVYYLLKYSSDKILKKTKFYIKEVNSYNKWNLLSYINSYLLFSINYNNFDTKMKVNQNISRLTMILFVCKQVSS